MTAKENPLMEQPKRRYTCPKYEPADLFDGRCKHYENRRCSLVDAMCFEWLRANFRRTNGHPVLMSEQPAPESPAPNNEPATDLAKFIEERVASFKALGVEVRIDSKVAGEVWLVADYTGRTDRKELSIEDSVAMRLVMDVFPNSRVTKVKGL